MNAGRTLRWCAGVVASGALVGVVFVVMRAVVGTLAAVFAAAFVLAVVLWIVGVVLDPIEGERAPDADEVEQWGEE